MTINRKTKTTISALAAVMISASTALAAPAIATGNVNVRTGPSTSYSKVDTLAKGEHVDVRECQSGWCYVEHKGPDGWVSGRYLGKARTNPGRQRQNPNINFGFGFSNDGVTFGFGFGNGGMVFNPPRQQRHHACVYTQKHFNGARKCFPVGTTQNYLNSFWNNNISSIKVQPGATLTLCRNSGLNGRCRSYANSRSVLPQMINNKASSLTIY